jgi:hypothetical protein
MKKFVILTLALFAFASCGKDDVGGGGKLPHKINIADGKAYKGGAGGTHVTEAMEGDLITLVPDSGKGTFLGWTAGENSPQPDAQNRFTMPNNEVSYVATFQGLYPIRVEKGFFTIEGSAAEPNIIGNVAEDAKVILTPDPKEIPAGWEFSEWSSPQITDAMFDKGENGVWSFLMPAATAGVVVTMVAKPIVVELTLVNCTVDGKTFIANAEVDKVYDVVMDNVPAGKTFIRWTAEKTGEPIYTYPAVDITTNKFTMPFSNITLTAVMEELEPQPATYPAPYLLYYDGQRLSLGMAQITNDPIWFPDLTAGVQPDGTIIDDYVAAFTYEAAGVEPGVVTRANAVYVKFGSLLGLKNSWNSDGWGAEDVIFNPLGSFAGYGDFNNVPYMSYSGNNATAIPDYVTANHTNDNVYAGKGDICKLVGLTQQEAYDKWKNGSLHTYNSGYRTMTIEDWKVEFPVDSTPRVGFRSQLVIYALHENPNYLLPLYPRRAAGGGQLPAGQSLYDTGNYMSATLAAGENMFSSFFGKLNYAIGLNPDPDLAFYQPVQLQKIGYGAGDPNDFGTNNAAMPVRCIPN